MKRHKDHVLLAAVAAPMALNASADDPSGTLLRECDDLEFLRGQVEHLYKLLDDIDTASDMFKPCDSNEGSFEAFYNYAMRRQRAKTEGLESDGYKLFCVDKREEKC